MKLSSQRKFAVIMSFLSSAGIFGAIAIVMNAATLGEFIAMTQTSPRIMFLLIAGLLSLIIGVVLLVPVVSGKKTQLVALLLSAAVFAVAAVQMSITLLFVLLWPWSIYKLYRSKTA